MAMRMINYFVAHIVPNSEYTWTRLIYSHLQAPMYHLYFEVLLVIGIVWLFFQRRYRIKDKVKLTAAEKAALIDEWQPEDLVPKDWTPSESLLRQFHRRAVGPIGKYVQFHVDDLPPSMIPSESEQIAPIEHLNCASFNFLNFIGDPGINKAAIACLERYGVGACGPRGFYGTFDVHLELEEALQRFLDVDKAVVYSYGAATLSSAIPSYAKRNDVIFVDEGISHVGLQGIVASRSTVHYFRHNDMEHLEEQLVRQAEKDLDDPKRASLTRRFLVVEGLYVNYGDLCPLPRLVELKYKYKVRILLDEAMSFGAVGKTGRGVTEHFGIDLRHIDLMCGSLETSIGSVGGFVAGSNYVIKHQELSGQGYCFSASAPPMLAAGAIAGLDKLSQSQGQLERLSALSRQANDLAQSHAGFKAKWHLAGSPDSPIKHLRLKHGNSIDALERATEAAFGLSERPVLLTVARYAYTTKCKLPEPSVRLTLNSAFTDDELTHVFDTLADAI